MEYHSKYTGAEVDALLDKVNNGGSNFDSQGVYPDLTAGDLAGRGESVPASFGFRASGGKSIKDGRAYIKRIKGNSVVWNNMVDTRGYEGGFFTDLPFDIIQGHKYLLQRTHANDSLYLIAVINGEEKYEISLRNGVYAAIIESPYTGDSTRIFAEAYCGACIISDLTKMFGAGNEPTTIEEYEARKPIVEDEFAYNEGEVIHMTAEGIKSIGDNAWDEQWEQGGLSEGDGQEYDSSSYFRSKNFIRILPNTPYYFRKPAGVFLLPFYYDENKNFIAADDVLFTNQEGNTFTTLNASYMRFYCNQPTYNNDIMLTLVHSGWKQDTDAGYQPYWQDTLPLPIISKYFPDGMMKAGSAHDEIRYNKATQKWEAVQRIGSVDLGTLEWSRYADGFYLATNLTYAASTAWGVTQLPNVVSSRYAPALWDAISESNRDKACSAYDSQVRVSDTDYTDAASFKAAMQGVMFYYELAEPIVTEITEDFRDYYNVADFGTEMSQSNTPSAPFSADIIYQFNAVDMIREHELEITELQKVIATMQAQLASLTNN